MSTNRRPHPPQLRAEAFDLYLSGLSRPRVHGELVARHGDAAPGLSTVKRWSKEDDWARRRSGISRRGGGLGNALSLDAGSDPLSGDQLTVDLYVLRHQVLAAFNGLPFHSAEGALYALAALERVIESHEDRQTDYRLREQLRAVLSASHLLSPGGSTASEGERDPSPPGAGPLSSSVPVDP